MSPPKGYVSPFKGIPRTEADKLKISIKTKEAMQRPDTHKKMLEQKHDYWKGRKHTKETIEKMKTAAKNIKHPKGYKLDEQSKKNMRKPKSQHMKDKLSETQKIKPNIRKFGTYNPHWKGGKKLAEKRSKTKRKRELGFIPLNIWESDNKEFVGHHLDKENVLYIPKTLHLSIRHTRHDQESIVRINEKAFAWYNEYYGLEE